MVAWVLASSTCSTAMFCKLVGNLVLASSTGVVLQGRRKMDMVKSWGDPTAVSTTLVIVLEHFYKVVDYNNNLLKTFFET